MAKLSDTQSIILVHAAQRDSGSVYPLPETLRRGGGTARAITALVGAGFAEERETGNTAEVHRNDGDLSFGLFVTAAGLVAIGVADGEAENGAVAHGPPLAPVPDIAPARITITSTVVALLARQGGATLPELIEATGWLPHTTRAALTGLRKKGHSIVRGTREGTTCYRIEVAA